MIQQATQVANPFLDQAREQLANHETNQVQWLVIAHHDEPMLERLADAFASQSSIVVAAPQGCWDLGHQHAEALIQWAAEELQVEGVLVVGHSRGGVAEAPVRVLDGNQTIPGKTKRFNSLADRLQFANQRVICCEDFFLEQLEKVASHTAVIGEAASRRLRVEGLFYRAETEVFCVFDADRGEFRALMG